MTPFLALQLMVCGHAQTSLADLEREQREIFEKAAPSVVLLSGEGGFGTGFSLTEELFLTNAHVVSKDAKLEAILLDGRRTKASVVRADSDSDLALVSIPETSCEPLTASSGVSIGSWVASIGHGAGGGWTFTTGMVTNIYNRGHGSSIFQTQIPVNPGNSGGPVLDRFGRVAGVVTSGLTGADSVNFAIRIDEAFRVFPELDEVCGCLVITAPEKAPVFLDGAHVGNAPRVVVWPEPGTHEVSLVVGGVMVKKTVSSPEQTKLSF